LRSCPAIPLLGDRGTERLADLHLKETVRVRRLEDNSRVRCDTGSPNADYVSVGRDQPGVGRHHRDLDANLHPLPEQTKRMRKAPGSTIGFRTETGAPPLM